MIYAAILLLEDYHDIDAANAGKHRLLPLPSEPPFHRSKSAMELAHLLVERVIVSVISINSPKFL